MASHSLIDPQGEHLVNHIVDAARSRSLGEEAAALPSVELSPKQACDLEMIGIGAFSPLVGFARADDFESLCERLRLADGTLWPIAITLAVNDTIKATLAVGGRASLRHSDGTILAVIDIQEIYPHDRKLEIPNVFETEDNAHPGVKEVLKEGDWLAGGPIDVLRVAAVSEGDEHFEEFRLPPAGGSRNQTGHRGVRPRPSEAACSMGPVPVGVRIPSLTSSDQSPHPLCGRRTFRSVDRWGACGHRWALTYDEG